MMYQLTKQDVTYLDYPIQNFSSSSTRIDETDITDIRDILLSKWFRERPKKSFYHSFINLLEIDLSSVRPHFEIKRETSSIEEVGTDITRIISEEEIILDMVEHDFVVKMSPKKKYKIHVVVRNVKKGKPRVVEPDEFLF